MSALSRDEQDIKCTDRFLRQLKFIDEGDKKPIPTIHEGLSMRSLHFDDDNEDNAESAGKLGWTPLRFAAIHGDPRIIRGLIKLEEDVSDDDGGSCE